jgi:cytochrome c
MRKKLVLSVSIMSLLSTACSSQPDAESPDQNVVEGTAATEDKPVEVEPELSDLAAKGKSVFLRCRSCHTLKEGDVHLTGPNLHGLFGATAGMKDGYVFSDPLKASGVTWTAETLEPWIENPRLFVQGNKMAFPGIPGADDRTALIEYLKETTN